MLVHLKVLAYLLKVLLKFEGVGVWLGPRLTGNQKSSFRIKLTTVIKFYICLKIKRREIPLKDVQRVYVSLKASN